MVLQLHVWGPAFGLPSLDAECLAAMAYLAQTTSPADYRLVQSSPSAVPTQHLPALHDTSTSTSTWTSSFSRIANHLQTHPPPTFHDPTIATATATAAASRRDTTAYSAFLTQHAAPLLALSLHVSPANYAAATRPAYSAVLPFPLPWTEPPAARAAMARRAAHLVGLSSGLDLDADDADADADASSSSSLAGRWGGPTTRMVGGKRAVGGVVVMAPEERARIRLEAVAGEVLYVLGEVAWERQTVELRCLAFGYLALMVVPEVPRAWLREVMQRRYPSLCEFVAAFRGEVFAAGRTLPWEEGRASGSAVAVGARFARGLVRELPVVGELWTWWWTARKKRRALARKGVMVRGNGGDPLLLLGAGLLAAAASAGIYFYRGLPPFGAPVQSWRTPAVGLSAFGAAGALFSQAAHVEPFGVGAI